MYTNKKRIAIFASGTGSNAEKIIEYFNQSSTIEVALIACNNKDAGVLSIAKINHIPSFLIEKEIFFRGNAYMDELQNAQIGFIILAGFLWKIPLALIREFPKQIINIHPALLPKYGGKGMYGRHVHEAVIANGDSESGITIHIVDEIYDHGKILFQANCPVLPIDTPYSLAHRIHELEYAFFSKEIEKYISGFKN